MTMQRVSTSIGKVRVRAQRPPPVNVQSQRSCCSLNTLVCSFNSSNTLVFCTIDWFQDGRAWGDGMQQSSLCQRSHRRFFVVSQSRFPQPSIYPQMKMMTLTVKLSGLFPDTIKTPTYPLSMSTIVSTVALACASHHGAAGK